MPHSGISGSKCARHSPEHFAVRRALHRLLAPRHPPAAHSSFFFPFAGRMTRAPPGGRRPKTVTAGAAEGSHCGDAIAYSVRQPQRRAPHGLAGDVSPPGRPAPSHDGRGGIRRSVCLEDLLHYILRYEVVNVAPVSRTPPLSGARSMRAKAQRSVRFPED